MCECRIAPISGPPPQRPRACTGAVPQARKGLRRPATTLRTHPIFPRPIQAAHDFRQRRAAVPARRADILQSSVVRVCSHAVSPASGLRREAGGNFFGRLLARDSVSSTY